MPGTDVHRRDLTKASEGNPWNYESGALFDIAQFQILLITRDLLDNGANYRSAWNIVQLFITIGITLAYTLGMFFSWRFLAVLGTSQNYLLW